MRLRKHPKIRFMWDGIEWGGPTRFADGSIDYWFYFYWWNVLPKSLRYWGPEYMYYDGPHRTFGLWFINFGWSTQWTKVVPDPRY